MPNQVKDVGTVPPVRTRPQQLRGEHQDKKRF